MRKNCAGTEVVRKQRLSEAKRFESISGIEKRCSIAGEKFACSARMLHKRFYLKERRSGSENGSKALTRRKNWRITLKFVYFIDFVLSSFAPGKFPEESSEAANKNRKESEKRENRNRMLRIHQ